MEKLRQSIIILSAFVVGVLVQSCEDSVRPTAGPGNHGDTDSASGSAHSGTS